MKRARRAQWFAVSTVLAFERRRKPRYLVFESVVLFRARSAEEAARRAETAGRKEAEASGEVTWKGEPVRTVFAGVRKVVPCAANPDRAGGHGIATVHDGAEATYSQFIVETAQDLKRFAGGGAVKVVYER